MTLKEQPLPDKKPHTCLTNSKGIFHMKDDILVFVEKRNGQLQKISAKLIGGARRLAKKSGGRVLALLAGYQLAEDAKRLQRAGADEVLLADSLSLAEYSIACYADVCQAALRTVKPFLFLFGSTTIGIGLASALGGKTGRRARGRLYRALDLTGSAVFLSYVASQSGWGLCRFPVLPEYLTLCCHSAAWCFHGPHRG